MDWYTNLVDKIESSDRAGSVLDIDGETLGRLSTVGSEIHAGGGGGGGGGGGFGRDNSTRTCGTRACPSSGCFTTSCLPGPTQSTGC